MNPDTVELDLPHAPLSADSFCDQEPAKSIESHLIEERKRFDEERQQLRRELSTLKCQFHEHDQRLRIILEQEKAKLLQENLQLTSELFMLRGQLRDQTRDTDLRKENEALRARLSQLEQEVAQLREQSECDAVVREFVAHDQVDASIDAERQHSSRVVGNPIPVLITPRDEEGEALSGWIVARSLSGLTLLLDQELAIDSVWRVKNARPTCTRPEWVAVTIKDCVPHRTNYKLDGQFLHHPTWQDMQQFW